MCVCVCVCVRVYVCVREREREEDLDHFVFPNRGSVIEKLNLGFVKGTANFFPIKNDNGKH